MGVSCWVYAYEVWGWPLPSNRIGRIEAEPNSNCPFAFDLASLRTDWPTDCLSFSFFWAFRISDLIRRRSAVVPLPFPYQSSVKWEFFFRSRSVTGLFMESRLLLSRWLDYQVGNEEPSTADHLFLLKMLRRNISNFFLNISFVNR